MMNKSFLKKLGLVVVVVALVLSASQSAEGGWNEGYDAYMRDDFTTALKEFRPLAEQGNASAQFNLGLMYRKGWGVPKDYVLAYMWFNISATNGDKDVEKSRDIVEKKMTPQQIADAQKLSREWLEKHKKK